MRKVLLVIVMLGAMQISAQTKIDQDLILKLVNEARSVDCKCGHESKKQAPPLIWDDKLEVAARRHANDMARKKFFSHTGSDNSSVSQRVDKVGFKWRTVGENLAMGRLNEAEVVKGWMDSPGHCNNIMNPDFKRMGVAISSDGKYWVQVFATAMDE